MFILFWSEYDWRPHEATVIFEFGNCFSRYEVFKTLFSLFNSVGWVHSLVRGQSFAMSLFHCFSFVFSVLVREKGEN